MILHEYAHILHVLRYLIVTTTTTMATYVEIGVGLGVTSIFMSRHPLLTHVYGVKRFHENPPPHDEAELYRQRLQGKGEIHWMTPHPNNSTLLAELSELQTQLDGKPIDILFLANHHHPTVTSVKEDFELYAPLVADGGFIVFDNFLNTQTTPDVRQAIMELIRDGEIHLEQYEIIGSVHNSMGAGPVSWMGCDDPYISYDWQSIASNEFIIRKRSVPIA